MSDDLKKKAADSSRSLGVVAVMCVAVFAALAISQIVSVANGHIAAVENGTDYPTFANLAVAAGYSLCGFAGWAFFDFLSVLALIAGRDDHN